MVELDELDRKLLVELDKNCRSSSIELGGRLGKSRQTIDYRIKRMIDLEVITNFRCSFNATKLGFRLFKIHLRLRNVPSRVASLRSYLTRLANVYWIGESSGSWDLLIGVLYKNEQELFAITNELSTGFHDVIVGHSGHQMISIIQFPKMYISRGQGCPVEHTGDVEQLAVDEMDLRIINELVKDARVATNRLADVLGMSAMAIQRRIKRLEELGIIIQYRIGIDLKKLGLSLYKAIIQLDRYGSDDHKKFYAFISSYPELQFFVRNFWSLELELVVPGYSAYESIFDDIRRYFPRLINSVETLLLDSDEWPEMNLLEI